MPDITAKTDLRAIAVFCSLPLVGMDVHKESCSVAIRFNDAPAIDFVTPADNKKLTEALEKLRPALKLIAYEAGPT